MRDHELAWLLCDKLDNGEHITKDDVSAIRGFMATPYMATNQDRRVQLMKMFYQWVRALLRYIEQQGN